MRRPVVLAMVLAVSGCADPCEPDEYEGNDAETEVTDLGSISDSGNHITYELTLHSPDDADWFTFVTVDGGIDGNPEVWINVDGGDADIELELSFSCSGDPIEYFSCSGSPTDDGCVDRGKNPSLRFGYDCEGSLFDSTDNGIVILSVR
ncbi:MAG: hypothetical protein HOV80_21750 [Polyangiaceae bacterium]|nr:hypothetical protein [Polyangiaceae bacterium]